jgi:hypothetical protein
MDDVKDNPVAKRFIEIAGKERIEEQTRRTLARVLVKHAVELNLDLPENAESLLAAPMPTRRLCSIWSRT